MGHTKAKVEIYGSDPSRSEEVELLVDTGSTYTWISKDLLEDIEIAPEEDRKFRTIEGEIVRRPIAEALVKCKDRKATTVVVFAGDEDEEVIGVYTLEGLGLEIDPTTEELRKVEAVLAI